ncbi:hypothetical protein PR202_gb04274 [Eleusine coracana subsp. coracana]|uniref:Coatomer subunit zeta n=1 Tax=Eleusine coracana subsp. coracana TaxID=191504 RepID=A0AAV5E374_ELECO|nr:hypothetical protein PR202_gb04274 [Eleusine coracana subsp. coracana]
MRLHAGSRLPLRNTPRLCSWRSMRVRRQERQQRREVDDGVPGEAVEEAGGGVCVAKQEEQADDGAVVEERGTRWTRTSERFFSGRDWGWQRIGDRKTSSIAAGGNAGSLKSEAAVARCSSSPVGTRSRRHGTERGRAAVAEVVMFDGHIVVYKFIQGLSFFVTGGEEENELILESVLEGFSEAVACVLPSKKLNKKTALENLDLIFLCLDEVTDEG